jgi:hypothetical protein
MGGIEEDLAALYRGGGGEERAPGRGRGGVAIGLHSPLMVAG